MPVSIKVDPGDQASMARLLVGIKNGVPRALTTSINKAIKTTQVQAVKQIGQVINLKAARIKADFYQERATWSNIRGALVAIGDPVGLINFGANQVKAGVSVKVLKAGARSVLKGAFKAYRGTKEHVYRRQYHKARKPIVPGRKYGRLPDKYRKPVERLTGPRIEDIYARPIIYNSVSAIAADKFAENMAIETATLIRRFG